VKGGQTFVALLVIPGGSFSLILARASCLLIFSTPPFVSFLDRELKRAMILLMSLRQNQDP
jgi:hypothetical protein